MACHAPSDLGSGLGKTLLIAAACLPTPPLHTCLGVEVSQELHDSAGKIVLPVWDSIASVKLLHGDATADDVVQQWTTAGELTVVAVCTSAPSVLWLLRSFVSFACYCWKGEMGDSIVVPAPLRYSSCIWGLCVCSSWLASLLLYW